jgi:hypothetical protein
MNELSPITFVSIHRTEHSNLLSNSSIFETRYATANLERLNDVADALEVSVRSEIEFAH